MNGWGDPLRSSATARKPAYLAVRRGGPVTSIFPGTGGRSRQHVAISWPHTAEDILSLLFLRENHVPVILIGFGNRFLALAPAIAGG